MTAVASIFTVVPEKDLGREEKALSQCILKGALHRPELRGALEPLVQMIQSRTAGVGSLRKATIRIAYETRDVEAKLFLIAALKNPTGFSKQAGYSKAFLKWVTEQSFPNPAKEIAQLKEHVKEDKITWNTLVGYAKTGGTTGNTTLKAKAEAMVQKIHDDWAQSRLQWAMGLAPDVVSAETHLTQDNWGDLKEGDLVWASWNPYVLHKITGFNKTKTGKKFAEVMTVDRNDPSKKGTERVIHMSSASNPHYQLHVMPSGHPISPVKKPPKPVTKIEDLAKGDKISWSTHSGGFSGEVYKIDDKGVHVAVKDPETGMDLGPATFSVEEIATFGVKKEEPSKALGEEDAEAKPEKPKSKKKRIKNVNDVSVGEYFEWEDADGNKKLMKVVSKGNHTMDAVEVDPATGVAGSSSHNFDGELMLQNFLHEAPAPAPSLPALTGVGDVEKGDFITQMVGKEPKLMQVVLQEQGKFYAQEVDPVEFDGHDLKQQKLHKAPKPSTADIPEPKKFTPPKEEPKAEKPKKAPSIFTAPTPAKEKPEKKPKPKSPASIFSPPAEAPEPKPKKKPKPKSPASIFSPPAEAPEPKPKPKKIDKVPSFWALKAGTWITYGKDGRVMQIKDKDPDGGWFVAEYNADGKKIAEFTLQSQHWDFLELGADGVYTTDVTSLMSSLLAPTPQGTKKAPEPAKPKKPKPEWPPKPKKHDDKPEAAETPQGPETVNCRHPGA
jgi:preprotein translocase subunit YajC